MTVNWGGWVDLGLAQTAGARRTIEELERRGVGGFAAAQGIEALAQLLDRDATQAIVAPIDWARFAKEAGRTRLPSLAGDLVGGGAVSPVGGTSVREALGKAPGDEWVPLLRTHLQQELAKVLRLDVRQVDIDKPMGTLGLESLTALEFRRRLESTLETRLSATIMWNYPTVRVLGDHLGGRLGLGATAATSPEAAASNTTLVMAPAATDEDAMRALLRRKGRAS